MGASNLSRGYDSLTRCLKRNLEPRPVNFLSALGPGRAYCAFGGAMTIAYPPIGSSQIFSEAKDQCPAACRKIALITDLGNDIMYGIPPEEIIAELKNILQRLEDMDADALITPIPATLISQLTPAAFRVLKAVFFPRSQVERLEAIAAIEKINQVIHAGIGSRAAVISGLENFMGWDKIHYGLFQFGEVWSKISEEILRALGVGIREKIGASQVIPSYAMNMKRLVFSDLLGLTRKGPEFL